MMFTTRLILILTLLPVLVGRLYAQETTATAADETASGTAREAATTTATTTTTTAATTTAPSSEEAASEEEARPASYEVRRQFTSLLQNRIPELVSILTIEPGLLNNEPFVAQYPELAAFIAEHPEMRIRPSFYMAAFAPPMRSNSLDQVFEPLLIMTTISLIAFALAWLVRAVIEQKRWTKLSRTQSEVHNKILDRFGTTAELLEYIRTPAGTKFLESAPIPLHSEQPVRQQNGSLTRVLWSIQIGVVVAAGGLGMLLVSLRHGDEGQGLFALGAIALCLGIGFIASAGVSLFLSRRLGLWSEPAPADGLDQSGLMR